MAVQSAIDSGRFEDPAWVEDWDVAFAQLYLNALDAGPPEHLTSK
jgi:hypothetical protein